MSISTQDAFPPVAALPHQRTLPDPFMRLDGGRITSPDQWPAQREYLKAMLSHYMYGQRPPRPEPDQLEIQPKRSSPAFEGKAIEEHYTLRLSRNGRAAEMDIALFRPAGQKRSPTIVKNCRALFDKQAAAAHHATTIDYDLFAAREAIDRGYMLCKFTREQWAADRPDARDEGVYPLYPEYDWGAIAVWSWAQSVVLDALDRLGLVEPGKTICTGHSRGGQTAIAAGIYDERFAVVVPCTGGYGSCATLRDRDPKGVRGDIDYIAHLKKCTPHWHCQRFHEFEDRQDQLPFDAHTLVALVAPRPLLNTNATEDQFNNTLAVENGLRAGRKVYRWLGAETACRLHWRPGLHAQAEPDWLALLDFADVCLHGKPPSVKFDQWQYPALRPRTQWSMGEEG